MGINKDAHNNQVGENQLEEMNILQLCGQKKSLELTSVPQQASYYKHHEKTRKNKPPTPPKLNTKNPYTEAVATATYGFKSD
jgi:hypothetical protein